MAELAKCRAIADQLRGGGVESARAAVCLAQACTNRKAQTDAYRGVMNALITKVRAARGAPPAMQRLRWVFFFFRLF